jgi:hypothetical protein
MTSLLLQWLLLLAVVAPAALCTLEQVLLPSSAALRLQLVLLGIC